MTSFVVDKHHTGQAPDVPQAHHVGTAYCVVGFKYESSNLVVPLQKGQCWHNLFRHCVVVSGYPISSRPNRRPGLEIPLEMMANLANAERITCFGDNLVIKGFATALFPSLCEDRCVFWHLVYNEDGSRISFADNRILVPAEDRPALKHLQIENMIHARHIVGWAAEIRNNTGTKPRSDIELQLDFADLPRFVGTANANYDVKWSALKRPCPGFAFEKIQINAGLYINAGATFCRGKRDRAIHIGNNNYVSSLRSIGDKFVMLHDLEVRKAWLVDGLSTLLHLVRASLEYACRSDYGCLSKHEDFGGRGGDGGRKVAYDALVNPNNLNLPIHEKIERIQSGDLTGSDAKFYCVRDIVKDILHILEQILEHQADSQEGRVGYRIQKSPWTQLEGFDFMDIATKSNIIHPRATELRADGEGWSDLTRKIHAVTLFGKGFGELLEPIRKTAAQDHCVKCLWNSDVPAGRDLLAISVSDLERIVERRGTKSKGHWKLVDDCYLHVTPSLFSTCSRSSTQNCPRGRVQRVREQKRTETEQVTFVTDSLTGWKWFMSKLNYRFQVNRTNGETKESPPPHIPPTDVTSGGILLGMEPTLLTKITRPLKGDQSPQTCQPPTPLHARLQTTKAQLPSTSDSSRNSIQDSSLNNQPSWQTTSVQLTTEATSIAGKSIIESAATLPKPASTAETSKHPNHASNNKGKARAVD
jgi:hypothetical protein